jgi:NOL1/NOP2/fmu family ribosome biogenesis protein/23S rRNA U2552 (ribose-2'-O)-methylase RlmE/FtsJ
MATAECVEVEPDWWILDMCAAPGGKSSQLRNKLGEDGVLISNEIIPSRCRILTGNVERLGFRNTATTCLDPARVAKFFPETFDLVMVDAPCSGEGMFRKEEAAVTDWSPETVEMCARRQREILESAVRMLRPGGRLVYSTCTFAPQENEETVEQLLANHPELSREPVRAPWFAEGAPGSFRLWPHKLLGEGHYAAVLRKEGDAPRAEPDKAPGEKLPKAWAEFAKELGISLPAGKALTFGQNLFWAPEGMPQLRGLKVERPGLELGTLKKDRFEPAHALALWLDSCLREENLEPGSRELEGYMKGDVVPSEKRGWCLVKAGKYPIGWGKGDGSVLKNHYPKGLRRV